MILDTPTRTLDIVLGEAAATTACDIIACYATTTTATFLTAVAQTTSNGTSAVTVVAAPPSGAQCQVNEVRLHNNDTITHTVKLRLNDGGTIRIVLAGSVAAGGDFLYTPSIAPVATGAGTGTVTSVIIAPSAFLNAGTITNAGTISSPNLAAQSLIGNAGTTAAAAGAIAIGPGLTLTAAGTLETTGTAVSEWNAGTVNAIGSGLTLAAGGTLEAIGGAGGSTTIIAGLGLTGGTITTSGTIALEASQTIRTIPFPLVGTLVGGQDMIVTLTQAGTLLANGGAPKAQVKVNPTATNTFTLNTINSGTVHTQGTISVSTAGVVTFPTFAAVPCAAGDSVELINQGTADATFANACLSLQFQVT